MLTALSTSEWAIKNKKIFTQFSNEIFTQFLCHRIWLKKSSSSASSESESVRTLKGSGLTHSCRTESWDWSCLAPVSHGCHSLKKWMKWSSDPSTERLSVQFLKDFTISQMGPYGLLEQVSWKGNVYWKGAFI